MMHHCPTCGGMEVLACHHCYAANVKRETFDKLLAACKLAAPEIHGLHYLAACVDDAISPEWRRLQRVKDALNEAIKLAEGDS